MTKETYKNCILQQSHLEMVTTAMYAHLLEEQALTLELVKYIQNCGVSVRRRD